MQTALPLARTLSNAVRPTSASRIPHLEYHIVRKAARSRKPTSRSSSASICQQVRHRSSTADPGISLAQWPTSNLSQPQAETESSSSHSLEDVATSQPSRKYASRSKQINFLANQQARLSSEGFVALNHAAEETISATDLIEEANPERLLAWLAFHPTGAAFTSTADAADFDRAFCAVDPDVLIESFKARIRYMGKKRGATDKHLDFDRSLVVRLRNFASQIDRILVKRQEDGAQLTLPVCRHALKCAASVGDRKMADALWDKIMPANGVEPDIECYNAFMEAAVWNLAYSEIAVASFRNTQRNMHLRAKIWRPLNLLGYSVSSRTALQEPEWTLKATVLAMFQELSSKALATSEATFTNLMLGLARAGDLSGVGSVLKSVWNIDVEALSNFDEEELESPTFYPEGHPLRPTSKLLFTIAHCYGINHSAAKAWSVLDYTSRNYAMDIPDHVWNELFQWTHVLSKPRSKAQRKQGQAAGKISLSEPENLFKAVTDIPYNVKPNAIMLDILARNLRHRRAIDKTLDILRLAEQDMHEELTRLKLMVDTIVAISKERRGITDNGIISEKFIKFRRDFQMTYLSAMYRYDCMARNVRRVLSEADWAGTGEDQTWPRRRLPQVIEEFQAYAPGFCEYKTKTGRVRLDLTGYRRQAAEDGRIRHILFEATQVWQALDPLDLFEVASRLKALPKRLEDMQRSRSLLTDGKTPKNQP